MFLTAASRFILLMVAGARTGNQEGRPRPMNEIAQWTAIALVLCATAWLFICIYSDR
jgi:hypothetical protein